MSNVMNNGANSYIKEYFKNLRKILNVRLSFLNLQMEPLFPNSDGKNAGYIDEFNKEVIKKLIPKRTLLQILREAEDREAWRLSPAKLQKEYIEFVECMRTLQNVLKALRVHEDVTRFNCSHPFAVGLGEAMQRLAQEEEMLIKSGGESSRLINEPPYVGGDPEMRRIEPNPGVKKDRYDLWIDLRAMYTRINVMYTQQYGIEYFLFERMQALWDENLRAGQIALAIQGTPGHECIPRIEICRKYKVGSYLLENELEKLRRLGHNVIIPTGSRWGLIPIDDEHFWNWEQYQCEFCGLEYCSPQPIKKDWELPSSEEVPQIITFPNFVSLDWH